MGGKHIVYARRAGYTAYDTIYMMNAQTSSIEYEFKSSSRGSRYLGPGKKLEHWHNVQNNQSIIKIFAKYVPNDFLEFFLFKHTSQQYEPAAYVTDFKNCAKFTQTDFNQSVCLTYNQIEHYSRLPSFSVLYDSTQT